MYLKLDQYFLEPNTDVVIKLFNGTFDRSDNVIDRSRMLDVSAVANGNRISVDTANWFEKETTTYLNFGTSKPGTYVAGVSTRARDFGMSAQDFNDYLEHDGVLDMLALRKENGTLSDTAIERYSKHVKTIFQVGDRLTDDYKTEFGYPIEFVLMENPYDIHSGHDLPVKLFFDQKPLANQLVYAGVETTTHKHTHDGHTHSHDDENTDHSHDELIQLRTDEQGMVNVPISSEGIWYLRTIHLVEKEEDGLTHESNWATVTFAIGEGHSHEHDHAHDDHNHDHNDGMPDYFYIIISLLIITGLFFAFNQKK